MRDYVLACDCRQNKIFLRNPACALWREVNILTFEFLDEYKLYAKSMWDVYEGIDMNRILIFYGHKEQEIEKLYLYQQKPYNHAGTGLLFGYPSTAAHSFSKETFRFSRLPKTIYKLLGRDVKFL